MSWNPKDDGQFPSSEGKKSLNLTPSASLQRKLDTNKWEDLQIEQAGIQTERKPRENQEIDEESECKVYLSVNTSRPEFLKGFDEKKFHQPVKNKKVNLEGDLYHLAQNGSQSVAEWKKHHEQQEDMRNLVDNEKGTRKTKSVMNAIKTHGSSQYKDSISGGGSVNRARLPIFQSRGDIIRMVAENNAIIIVGETGSGKTTQVTQFLHEEGYSKFGQIVCTQPRRVAAVSVAKRVADEMGVKLGEEVGYTIRFEDVSSSKTVIRYMTDGILLRESLMDPMLEKYSVIIMDEAHERSLYTDVLFGVLKKILSKRSDLRVIVTSATMDSSKFSSYFGGAPILNVSGRTYNVDISYLRTNPDDYVATAVTHILKVHLTEPPGDILVFMTGQDDVECTCELIRKKIEENEDAPPLEVLPIYSQLPADLQARVFEPIPIRKCVVATNIAETSLTINGIRYVIDSGFAKVKSYSSKAGLDTLLVQPISQAAAIQRAGRAGRTMDGKCWRLYSEMSFNYEMLPMAVPEIQRTNLANVILLLKSMGFNDVLSFNFMDSPPLDNFMHALIQLWSLRAINNEGNLTQLGKDMVIFPLDPILSKMILVGNKFHCLSEILSVVSMLYVPPVFIKPKGKEEEADSMKEKFIVPESDHLTLLHVYNTWESIGKGAASEKDRDLERSMWSKSHYLNNISLVKAQEVRKQLLQISESAGLKLTTCGHDWNIVRKAICSAYFHQVARLKGLNEYVNLSTGVKCYLHPSSALAGLGYVPEYIVYHELVLTSKHYIHGVTAVDPLWLSQMAPEFFTATDAFGNVLEEGKPPKEETKKDDKSIQKEKINLNLNETTTNHNIDQKEILFHNYDNDRVVLPPSTTEIRKRRRMK